MSAGTRGLRDVLDVPPNLRAGTHEIITLIL